MRLSLIIIFKVLQFVKTEEIYKHFKIQKLYLCAKKTRKKCKIPTTGRLSLMSGKILKTVYLEAPVQMEIMTISCNATQNH